MHRYLIYYLLIWLGWLSSCNQQPVTPARVQATSLPYFNLSAFISGQVKQLRAARVSVEKTVITETGNPETKVLPQINWAQELETFTQADINKPALRAAYTITKATTPDGQNKTTYRKRPGYRDAPVEYLEVSISSGQQVKQITGRYREDNYLVSSAKDFSLICAPVNGQNRVVAYQVSGAQKTVFFDSLHYQVQGRVR